MKFENKSMRVYLPVSINISEKNILVIGGGKVAAHKLNAILKFTNHVTVLAPEILDELANDCRLKIIEKPYEKTDLIHHHIIYACTNNRELNAKIKNDANLLGLLVNVADDPSLCDFVSPAIYKDDNITVAVGSNAQDVKKAIQIRDRIKQIMEDDQTDIEREK